MKPKPLKTMRDIISEAYVAFNVPSDQIVTEEVVLHMFTNVLRDRIVKEFTPVNVARALVTQRKAGHLPKIRRRS